jgi:CspA family cold shock protein
MHRRANPRRPSTPNGVSKRSQIMAKGTVKFFNATKGFGFIAPSDGAKDVFVHISALERSGISTLREGDKVSYEVVTDRGKLAASNIQMD